MVLSGFFIIIAGVLLILLAFYLITNPVQGFEDATFLLGIISEIFGVIGIGVGFYYYLKDSTNSLMEESHD